MKRVGDLISVIFDKKFIEKTKGYSALFDCWDDLMIKNGIAIVAGHSWIKSVEKGLVWIEVDHPGTKQILQTKESKLLHDFQYRFPDMGISGISIVLCKPGSGNRELANKVGAGTGNREEDGEQRAEQAKASADQKPAGPVTQNRDIQYGEIKDEALRAVLERLEKHIVEKEKEQ
jgi:hypothetical protein